MKQIFILALTICAALAVPVDQIDPTSPDARIVGGTAVPIEQFPWIVSIIRRGTHNCGGSIIRPNRILTAAHCISEPIGNYQIRAGSTLNASGGQLVAVARAILHPLYRPIENDIAILWLATALNVAPTGVAVIPMPAQGAGVAAGAVARVAGWGILFEGSTTPSPNLQAITVNIVSNPVCAQNYRRAITADMVCAGYAPGGRGVCSTDSGGPLTLNGQVVGVVSFSSGCGRPNLPGVYARVSHFRNWIEANL